MHHGEHRKFSESHIKVLENWYVRDLVFNMFLPSSALPCIMNHRWCKSLVSQGQRLEESFTRVLNPPNPVRYYRFGMNIRRFSCQLVHIGMQWILMQKHCLWRMITDQESFTRVLKFSKSHEELENWCDVRHLDLNIFLPSILSALWCIMNPDARVLFLSGTQARRALQGLWNSPSPMRF